MNNLVGVVLLAAVAVTIVSAQNKPPIWNNTLKQELRIKGIKENLPPGFSICCISAIDPEGGPITYEIAANDLFQIEKTTGVFTLKKSLDREENAIIQVVISASDGTNTIDLAQQVAVIDVNDQTPQVVGRKFAEVYENASIGDVIFDGLTITDRDTGVNALLDIECAEIDALSNASCPIFQVESYQTEIANSISYSVRLRMKKTVDYEILRAYIVTLRITDQGNPPLSTLVNIIVDVKNVQDSPPIWVENPINTNVPDGADAGKFVELVAARDRDGDPREIVITIDEDLDDMFKLEPFEIDQNAYTWMEIYLKKPVDREVKTSYRLTLKAEEKLPDGSLSGVFTKAIARVTVLDINDEEPTFIPAVLDPMEIQEELADRSEVPIMMVRDRDTPNNGKFKLTLIQEFEAFEVNPPEATNVANLRLTVKNSKFLDYEVPAYREQIIKIVAKEYDLEDQENGPFSSTATVTIRLLDENDNYPIFDEQQYVRSVSENLPVGSSVLQVLATDLDTGSNGQVTYSLEGSRTYLTGINEERFNIDPTTGVITLNHSLNFERQESISMFVQARDGGGLQSSVKLLVRVVDVNDEAPVFSLSEYSTFVEENDNTLTLLPEITVLATDTEANAEIRYAIAGGNTPDGAFSMNMNTGKLALTRAVKYEETPASSGLFRLNISASDSGTPPKFGYTLVKVTVYDQNDNPPEFAQFDYRTSVSEIAAPGTSIFQVQATDKDSGINGEIIYRITNGSLDHFAIDSSRGTIRVGSSGGLDYDRHTKYIVTVVAEDKGSPPRSGFTYVTIDVEDANNKSPFFPNELILAQVPSNARAGHEIVNLNAIDLDTDKLLEYRMIPESFVAVSPDGSSYGSGLQFQMTVNSSTGLIYLIQSLDTQGASEFSFGVVVQDNNAVQPPIQRAHAVVVCTVYKETGTMPEFNSPWTISNPMIALPMQEEQPENTVVTTLIASDPLTGDQLSGFTEVQGSDPDDYFRVFPDSGQIMLNKRVDFDTIQSPQVSVQVEVKSKDGTRSARARVVLNVQNINDNNPFFLRANYEFQITENKVSPSQVGVVQARDNDRGDEYGQITYSISGRGSQKFFIDPKSGFINVARGATLDREIDAQYELLVIASNEVQGEPNNKKATSVMLTIKIIDENDVTPHFEQTEYTIYAVQTAEAQSSLGRVQANDEDEGTNGQIDYKIKSGNEFNLFFVNPSTGEIRSRTKLLNFARVRPYSLLVQAKDSGFPSLVGSVPVYIYIQDLQAYDGRPKFQAPFPGQIIAIPEEEPPNYFVVQVVASDNDGPDELVRFSFLTGDEHADHQKFRIDPITGVINTTVRLDREVQESYNLLVLARDADNPPQENTIVVLVKLIDKNDSIPTFYACNTDATDPLYASVMENEPPQSFVTRVISCDSDTGVNKITYHRITCGNEENYFQIELLTGVITTTKIIDRELTPEFSLCVRVSNRYDVLMSMVDKKFEKRDDEANSTRDTSLIHVKIAVGDEDDNGPSYAHFAERRVTVGIPIIAAFGSPVLDARVVDPDGLTNSIVQYEVTTLLFRYDDTAKNAPNMFTLGEFSGLIRTGLASYSDYAHGYFEMRIKAKDKLNRPSSLTVFIYILSQSQRLKFVFVKQPDAIRTTFPAFERELKIITGVDITVDDIRYSVGDDASFDYSRTDVCFHGVHDTELINYQDAQSILNYQYNAKLERLYTDAGMERIGLCTFGMKSYTHWTTASFWWVIIIVALALIVFACICIFVICAMWKRYRAYMDTHKTYIVPPAVHHMYETRPVVEPSTLYVILGDEQPAQIRTPNMRRAGSPRPASMRDSGLYAEVRNVPAQSSDPPSNPDTPM